MRNVCSGELPGRVPIVVTADFMSKISVVIEETDETIFWLELLRDTRVFPECRLKDLLKEANELLAIFGASQRTCKAGALLTG